MGHRANLILGGPDAYELHYTHWRANTLDSALFWGPDAAIDFIRRQRSVAEGAEWLDEVWAEGGAVVDSQARVALWFGGGDVRLDVPLRRVHLALMREMWPGWDIRWADAHVADLASYVGRGVDDLLRRDRIDEAGVPEIREPEEPDWLSSVLSMRCANGRWKIHGCDVPLEEVALAGPRLASALRAADLPDAYDYAERSTEFPSGGLHVDESERRVEVWLGLPMPAFETRLRAAWHGWDVRWHRDRFEAIAERLGPRLVLPTAGPSALVEQVRSIVLRESRDRSGLVHDLIGRPATEDRKVEDARVNPLALRDDIAHPGPGRARAFESAVERWRARQP